MFSSQTHYFSYTVQLCHTDSYILSHSFFNCKRIIFPPVALLIYSMDMKCPLPEFESLLRYELDVTLQTSCLTFLRNSSNRNSKIVGIIITLVKYIDSFSFRKKSKLNQSSENSSQKILVYYMSGI